MTKRKWELDWGSGTEIIEGETFEEAMTIAGYRDGAIRPMTSRELHDPKVEHDPEDKATNTKPVKRRDVNQ